MSNTTMTDLQYPVGKFIRPTEITPEMIASWVATIGLFPARLEEAMADMPYEAAEWTYRPNGWNVRQVVHHCADSHMNALIRVKLALTEDKPTIKPYAEGLWAELADMQAPLEESLWIIKGVHARWERLLRALTEADFQRTFIHPDHAGEFTIASSLAMYAWHSEHHLAHVKIALKQA